MEITETTKSLDWRAFLRETDTCYESGFMKDLMARREQSNSGKSSMGRFDAAALYALVKTRKPRIAIETGTFRGMSSTFILKGMQDAHELNGRLFSIERRSDCGVGDLIPSELKDGFISVIGDVDRVLESNELPAEIDLFLHDSTHLYRNQFREFEMFWPRLKSGGLLISHDINLNASFVDFVSRTYFHNQVGLKDQVRTTHLAWGAVGHLGFIVKA